MKDSLLRYRKGDKLKIRCAVVNGEFTDVTISKFPDGTTRKESGPEQRLPLGIPSHQIPLLQNLQTLPMFLAYGSGSNGKTILRQIVRSIAIARGSSAAIREDGTRHPYERLNGKTMSVAIDALRNHEPGRLFLTACEDVQVELDIIARRKPRPKIIY
tara:strand:+ start:93 stop:566 length:474 start_codon:yes stop_codon:yes gene_type:complete